MKMEKHNEIIRDLCREQLLSLEMFQKGRSRVYLDDNGYYLTVVEFQPSAWGKGSYLNVGLHFLWNTWEHISFDACAGICGRVGGFVEYQNPAQFTADMSKLVALAREQVLAFREPGNVRAAVYTAKGGNAQRNRMCYQALHTMVPGAAEQQPLVRRLIREKRAILRAKSTTKKLPVHPEFDTEV